MKKALAVMTALLLVFSLASSACADALSDILEKGELVVGASVGFPPYEFYYTNPETGKEEYAGFDMSLAKGIAEELGVELVISDQSFAGLITALRAGEIDMIISGMAIKPEREEVVDFSISYYTGSQIMLVRAEDYDTLKTVEDMTGKRSAPKWVHCRRKSWRSSSPTPNRSSSIRWRCSCWICCRARSTACC